MPENKKVSWLNRSHVAPLRPRPPKSLFQEISIEGPPQPAAPLKKKRASRPKVRTGCLTCKIRRVKCDERKPTCARCQKADVDCDGYVGDTVPSTVDPSHATAGQATQLRGTHRPLRPRQVLTPPLLGLPLLEGLDVAYFDLFRYRMVHHLSGYRYTDLWSRIVLEAGMRDECIRHGILAVGALTMAIAEIPSSANNQPLDGGRPSVLAPWTHRKIVNHHHKHALRHHLKAITSFRERIQNPATFSPRCIHLMTLLLIVYEFMQGNNSGAKLLLDSGLTLLKGSITLYHGSPAQNSPDWKETEEDMDDIEHHLPCLSVMLEYSNQFALQDAQLFHLKCYPDDVRFPKLGRDPMSKLLAYWGRFFTFSIIFISKAVYVPRLHPLGSDYEVRIRAQQKIFLAHLNRWWPILRDYAATPHLDAASKKALGVVRLYWTVLYVHFNSCHDPTDLAFDKFDAEFDEIITRTLELFADDDDTGSNPSLTLGEGVASPLFFALRSCRNREIRMRAARAVGRLPWRDSGFDAQAMIVGKLAGVVMEEQGRDADGFIPASSRWFWMGGEWHVGKRAVVATYMRHAPDEQGQQVTKQLTLGIDNWAEVCRVAGCAIGDDLVPQELARR
ncbi:hypothetical protein ACHAQA_006878 [Verticillium albo-atrum]